MNAFPEPRFIDPRIRHEMRRLVRRVQASRLHARSACAWLTCSATAGAVFALAWAMGWPAWIVVALATTAFLACAWRVARWWGSPISDYRAAADLVEKVYPELGHSLRTALEQRPDDSGRYSFLQNRLLTHVLDHAQRHFWSRGAVPAGRPAAAAHAGALVLACLLVALAWRYAPPADPTFAARAARPGAGVEITPGDTEVERGSTVVITARFGAPMPANVHLQWRSADGATHRETMARSLADPVYARTLQHVAGDLEYIVEYDAMSSPTHHITVFDLPALVRGDAALEFPAFTGLEPKTIGDTRRVSAVEGTRLAYSIETNKPVREASLRAEDGAVVPLTPVDTARTRFRWLTTIENNSRFTLHLTDDAGRDNRDPPDLRVEALPNRRPVLKVIFPRGDQRVSPLEEVALDATAADDFGLLDYGVAWSLAGGEPRYLSHQSTTPGHGAPDLLREASFQHLLALEALGAEPAQLITWFAWADDMASDGTRRRTRGELAFAEVRGFDEIFRESEGGDRNPRQAGSAGGAAAELLDMQRDISLAIWKLRDQAPRTDAFHEDVSTVLDAQKAARRLLAQAVGEVTDRTLRAAGEEAGRHMDGTSEHLDEAREESTNDPLGPAWSSSQAAYQSLLRMQPAEAQVGRERNNAGGQRGQRSNQRQLDQLRFKDNEDRYETRPEAQLASTPEQREEMQTLARLRELAHRQSDLNDRLQQLQTALEAAKDDAEREAIQRELKRLEEEQRRMLADVDDLRQRMDQQAPGSQPAEAREQVDRTREEMRRASESLQEGAVSRALASGTRAEENLDGARDSLRKQSASAFAEDMRRMRREARELAEAQERTERELAESRQRSAPSLDTAGDRGDLARAMDDRREQLEEITRQLRDVTEAAEDAEPGLHRQLYELLREQGQNGGTTDRLATASELLRRGFTDQAGALQPEITQALNRLARGIDRAAETVLGDEEATMRYAQAELGELARAVRSEQTEDKDNTSAPRDPAAERDGPASALESSQSPTTHAPGERLAPGEALAQALEDLGRSARGSVPPENNPLTGDGFADWEERLRTVEALLDDPTVRDRLARAREAGATLRREFRHQGTAPLQSTIESGIVAPLSEVRAWLREELARRDDPTSLQPVDRDPVPEAFAESVQRYYESLGD